MTFVVRIDAGSVRAALGKRADRVLQEAAQALGVFARDRVQQYAGARISGQALKRFRDAITITSTKKSVVVELTDPKLAALEVGTPGFDIKVGLLNSSKAKRNKDGGRYIDVPFEHTIMRGAANSLVGSIRKAAKAAVDDVAQYGDRKRLFTGSNSRTGPLRRVANMRVDAGSPKPTLTTFRRVSDNSDPSSWLYPAKKGIGAFNRAAQDTMDISSRVIADMIKRALP